MKNPVIFSLSFCMLFLSGAELYDSAGSGGGGVKTLRRKKTFFLTKGIRKRGPRELESVEAIPESKELVKSLSSNPFCKLTQYLGLTLNCACAKQTQQSKVKSLRTEL